MGKNNKPAVPQTAPPEAYAAFVRLYMEWKKQEESEQLDLVKKNVSRAHNQYRRFSGRDDLLSEGGYKLHTADFDEYVNEVWVDFLRKCEDADEFAVYLQKDFERKLAKRKRFFDKMEARFLEIENAVANMSPEQEAQYRTIEEAKLWKEALARRKEWDIDYPSLNILLRRPAQRMMTQLVNEKSRNHISLDAKDNDTGAIPLEIEGVIAQGRNFEEDFAENDTILSFYLSLAEQDRKIIVLKKDGLKNGEIAKQLGVSDSVVSKHLDKMKSKLDNLLGITDSKKSMSKKQSKENK